MGYADQSAIKAFLAAPATHGSGDAVVRIDTHISRLFLTGALVFKLKRALRLPYLDFSTPELRLAACDKELRLNRRTAPELYLGVRRIILRRARPGIRRHRPASGRGGRDAALRSGHGV